MDRQQELNEGEDMILSLRKEIQRLEDEKQEMSNSYCDGVASFVEEIEQLRLKLSGKTFDDIEYRRGRLAGMEEAARIAETQFCCDDKEEEAIAKAIRKVKLLESI